MHEDHERVQHDIRLAVDDHNGSAAPFKRKGFLAPHTFYRARHYDPVTGRFLQRDPLGYVDGLNERQYVRSSPATLIDPDGRRPVRGAGSNAVNESQEQSPEEIRREKELKKVLDAEEEKQRKEKEEKEIDELKDFLKEIVDGFGPEWAQDTQDQTNPTTSVDRDGRCKERDAEGFTEWPPFGLGDPVIVIPEKSFLSALRVGKNARGRYSWSYFFKLLHTYIHELIHAYFGAYFSWNGHPAVVLPGGVVVPAGTKKWDRLTTKIAKNIMKAYEEEHGDDTPWAKPPDGWYDK